MRKAAFPGLRYVLGISTYSALVLISLDSFMTHTSVTRPETHLKEAWYALLTYGNERFEPSIVRKLQDLKPTDVFHLLFLQVKHYCLQLRLAMLLENSMHQLYKIYAYCIVNWRYTSVRYTSRFLNFSHTVIA